MTVPLPFLNGLRAFETAARCGSFTSAASDLHVTQAAVSQSVRLLERRLGFPLFHRRANGLELTPQGRALQPGLTDAFEAITRLVAQVSAMRAGPVLTVGVAPALALNWLIRSEERRGGQECVSTCRSRWVPSQQQKKIH